jgi:hypothetical protein
MFVKLNKFVSILMRVDRDFSRSNTEYVYLSTMRSVWILLQEGSMRIW